MSPGPELVGPGPMSAAEGLSMRPAVPAPRRRWAWLLAASLLGALFALLLLAVWRLEGRWFVVAIVGALMLSVGMMAAGHFTRLVTLALLLAVPLAGLAKWTFLDEDRFPQFVRDGSLYTGTLGVGIVDVLLVGAYLAWSFRVLALRVEPWPRLNRLDVCVLLLLLANGLSQWGAVQPLGIFAFEHQLKHALLYLYVSRHLHLIGSRGFIATICVAVLLESGLGVLQAAGVVPPGLIMDKGAGGDLLESQYRVPGIEDVRRATGSLYDSHALGTYIAMLLPFLLMDLYQRGQRPWLRVVSAVAVVLALVAGAVTYSRSAWLATALSALISMGVLLAWRERGVVATLLVGTVAVIVAGPKLLSGVFRRLVDAPADLLLARFDQFPVAWSIWREDFLFGAGAGNYMVRMDEMNVDWALQEPVHNAMLFIGAELGLFGVLVYYGTVFVVLARLWRLIRHAPREDARLAVAAFAGILAYLFDSMSNPLFREPTIYMWFWVCAALAFALPWPRPAQISGTHDAADHRLGASP